MIFEGICIITGNVSRLAQFYRELFDTTSEGNEEHTTVRIGGFGLALWKQSIPECSREENSKQIRKHHYSLMFSSTDVDQTCERAKKLGATILEEPADQPWGCRAFVMSDPDGNHIDVFEK